ncbi:hypothetical protein VKT23_007556 [Stygiomarasmius scandens]|uniref:Heterokaryon incompatibility domain-containing protein n=1 Tax=Marasmiellus scandens TaxID=2682957 RepID=A0ABR1JPV9_9AGAR
MNRQHRTNNLHNAPSHVQERPQRLIRASKGELVDFSSPNVSLPPYAIVSHRWLADEEVSYEEFVQKRPEAKKKQGFKKIVQACEQALRDKLEYVWIDTCCIDKRNPAEVSRQVKSMYKLYQHSEVCYAYLADVSANLPSPRSALSKSDWFQRGWTLQELVAPQNVVFFNKNWTSLGTKLQLKNVIYEMTGISTSVLEGTTAVHSVDIRTRLNWCAGRETTEPLDLAYCLLGILGVSTMEPDYGEDVGRAFQRLQDRLAQMHPGALSSFGVRQFLQNAHSRGLSRAVTGGDSKATPQQVGRPLLVPQRPVNNGKSDHRVQGGADKTVRSRAGLPRVTDDGDSKATPQQQVGRPLVPQRPVDNGKSDHRVGGDADKTVRTTFGSLQTGRVLTKHPRRNGDSDRRGKDAEELDRKQTEFQTQSLSRIGDHIDLALRGHVLEPQDASYIHVQQESHKYVSFSGSSSNETFGYRAYRGEASSYQWSTY